MQDVYFCTLVLSIRLQPFMSTDVQVCSHTGGIYSFSVQTLLFALKEENTILVKVSDLSDTTYHSRGKQKTGRGRNLVHGAKRYLANCLD